MAPGRPADPQSVQWSKCGAFNPVGAVKALFHSALMSGDPAAPVSGVAHHAGQMVVGQQGTADDPKVKAVRSKFNVKRLAHSINLTYTQLQAQT